MPRGYKKPTPDPTPDEIRQLCWQIQSTWSAAERRKRAAWAYQQATVKAEPISLPSFSPEGDDSLRELHARAL